MSDNLVLNDKNIVVQLNTASTNISSNNNKKELLSQSKNLQIEKELLEKVSIKNDLKSTKTGEFLPSLIKTFIKDDEYSEEKENLIILLESVKKTQLRGVFLTFFAYNSIKYVLWNYGYFALFFYHTRMMSVVLAGISCYLIDYNFQLKIEKYGLKGYYNKMKEDIINKRKGRVSEAIKRDLFKKYEKH
jgi:hypothetical protein